MALLEEARTSAPQATESPRRREFRWELLALVALAGTLELWNLSVNGWANEYYSAAVRSMTESWHNFLFVSFDPAGIMTVDKPPLSLWVQALSARVFGLSSWSILVPQALMTVGSVVLLYDLVRRRFGRVGGTVAGLALALTPMTVAIGRHNNPDALLVLCCVAALWFLVRALEDGRTKWIVWCGVMVGLAFETKMAAAFLVVPGLAAAFLWVAPRGRVAAAKSLMLGGAALVAVGGAWPLLVTLTPASDRPWISGTDDNSVWSLIFGYNGLGRLDGQAGGPGGAAGPGGGGGGGPFGGESGPLRLLHASLGGQAGWLLGFAIVSAIALIVVSRLRRSDARTGFVIAAGGCFSTCAVAFSFAQGIFHPYYVSQLAPFTAALVGAGVATLMASGRAAQILAPLAIAAGALIELVVIDQDATDATWAITVILGGGLLAVGLLVVRSGARTRLVAMLVAIAALLAAPAAWSVQTLGHATQGTFPAGGPEGSSAMGGPGGRMGGGPPPGMGAAPTAPGMGGAPIGGGPMGGGPMGMGGNNASLDEVIAYVNAHGGGTIGVASQSGAGSAIIQDGANIAGIGGFSGRESTVSVDWLADAVADGRIRWILADAQSGPFGGGMANDGRAGSDDAIAVAADVCTAVDTGSTTVYDCAGQADALRAAA